MNIQTIVSFTGDDCHGILAELAKITHELDGKWLDSRIGQLDGQMSGLIKIDLPEENLASLKDQFVKFDSLAIAFNAPNLTKQHDKIVQLSYHCTDKAGIVNEVSHALNEMNVYIEKMECHRLGVTEASNTMFIGEFELVLPSNINDELVIEKLMAQNPEAAIKIQ